MPPRTSPSRDPLPRFSDLEARTMQVVWDVGEATAGEVRRTLPGSTLNDSTVRTVLRRLEEKGYLAHRRDGRRFVYRATVGRDAAAAEAAHRIVDRICGGAVDSLLLGMVENGVIARRDIERVREALEDLEAREKEEGRRGGEGAGG